MISLKPSELPVGTVISDLTHGVWFKDTPKTWFNVSGEIGHNVFDGGPGPQDKEHLANVLDTPSDELFENFIIISLPFEITRQLAVRLNDELEYTSPEILIGETIESFQRNILQY